MKVKELAELFGYTGQWIKNRYDEGSIPKPVKGEIDVVKAAVGIVGYLKRRVESAEGARSELAKSRSALAEEEVLAKRQKRMKLSGELVPLADVELVWTARKTAVRQRVDQLQISKRDKEDLLEELEAKNIDGDFK